MIISLNWLNDFLSSPISGEEIDSFCQKLTLGGLEVTGSKKIHSIDGLVIGKVLKKEKHPDADKLNITEVEYIVSGEKQKKQIICGAANVEVNRHVIIATIGTKLEEDFIIKKAKIRGIESEGMICSKEEIGLEKKSEGIWLLPENASIENSVTQYLKQPDTLIEIDLTSNRYDCHSVQGIAKDSASILGCSYNDNEATYKDYLSELSSNQNFTIESQGCFEYTLTKIQNVVVNPSTKMIQNRLEDLEINKVNNLVDISNYLMLESGRPMHLFDADKVKGKIIIRQAVDDEKMTTIDGTELTLVKEDLVITDEEKVLCLAGIIGSNNSSITEETKNVLLELAEFSPISIRNSCRHHKIFTTASSYFEKGCFQNTLNVLNKTINFILESCPDAKCIDSYLVEKQQNKKKITFDVGNIKRILGIEISLEETLNIFKRLYFEDFQTEQNLVTMSIPLHRKDIQYENDLIEEIARIYGYNKIPNTFPLITNGENSFLYSSDRQKITDIARFLGYHQVYNYSFLDKNLLLKNNFSLESYVAIPSPINENHSHLRNSLLWGMLNTFRFNLDRKNFFNKCFEIGKVFSQQENNYIEEESFAFFATETLEEKNWQEVKRVDFHDLSQDVKNFLHQKGFTNFRVFSESHDFFTENSSATIQVNGQKIGVIGKLKSSILYSLELTKQDVFYAEINLTKLNSMPSRSKKYRKISVFPSIERDIALIFEEEKEVGKFVEQIKKASPLVSDVIIESIYHGKEIGEKKKSVAFKVEIQSDKETLSKQQGDEVVKAIVDKLAKKNTFELR